MARTCLGSRGKICSGTLKGICHSSDGMITLTCWQCCRALVSPKWYSATKEKRKMPPKWSSGRACGAASTTQRSQTTSKNFVRFQQKWYQKRSQISELMLERFPLRLEVSKGVKKQARTAPKHRRKGAKKELWPQSVAKRVPKRESLKIELLGFLCSQSNFDVFFIQFGSHLFQK